MMHSHRKPLVYSCSGCSSAAQMANHMAVKLDRAGLSEMSCIAGVGGGVPGLVATARSGRPILALDGCVLACVKASLHRAGVEPTTHVLLSELGVKKRKHADFDANEAQQIYTEHIVPAARALDTAAATLRDCREESNPQAKCYEQENQNEIPI
jgi:uncharacterized metal-binding protein